MITALSLSALRAFSPGNRVSTLLAICLLGTIAFSGYQLLAIMDARETIRVITVERDTALKDVGKAVSERDAAIAASNGWRQRFEDLSNAHKMQIEDATRRQQEAQEADARIIAELQERAEMAERSSAQRLINYNSASGICKATIEALPINCKELGTLK